MRVLLAGHNLDREVIREAAERGVDPDRLTPETLSAAYARISRRDEPVDELRRQAVQEVVRARASNERIVFGLGHASVAEHAVLSFDVMDLSRLAIEALERFRLCSYTEKSQRYIRLQDDFVLPEEIEKLGLAEPFARLIRLQHRAYEKLYEGILQRGLLEEEDGPLPGTGQARRRALEGRAKEDARYVTSLAQTGQLGMTANARSLELLIRRLAAHPLAEVRRLSAEILAPARMLAPSLIRYPDPGPADQEVLPGVARLADEWLGPAPGPVSAGQPPAGPREAVQLVACTPEGDLQVAAALLHQASGVPWDLCRERVRSRDRAHRAALFGAALSPCRVHDAMPRALELATLTFEVTVSAACFGQLKRHRMATVLAQPYDPALGTTLPPSVERAGLSGLFAEVMARSEDLFGQVARGGQVAAAPYALTQAHRRRVLLQMNARELVHFARLRQDRHAQWEIRQIADRMLELGQLELPCSLMLACGKDCFDELCRSLSTEEKPHDPD